jgi:predicted nucleic acid-binding protein
MTIIADSSYLVEGLLKDASLLGREAIVAPDLALYEVINAVWKHEVMLKDIKDGKPYIDQLFELASTQALQFVRPDRKIVAEAYKLALKKKCTFYDAIFVALAQELKLNLKTFDDAQRNLMR